MRVLLLVVALVACLGCSRGSASPSPSPSPSSSTAPLAACVPAKVALETFLVALQTSCKSTSDCDGYYLRPSACEGPIVLAKPGCPAEREGALEGLQAEVRRACPPDTVACSPRPFRAECRAGRCTDGLGPPMPR
ncbi:MAG TPA: hypothetical protein VF765_36690 [Polyangiaceae bacterium]